MLDYGDGRPGFDSPRRLEFFQSSHRFSTSVFAIFTLHVELFLLLGADSTISSNVSFVSHIVSSFLLLSLEF